MLQQLYLQRNAMKKINRGVGIVHYGFGDISSCYIKKLLSVVPARTPIILTIKNQQ